MCVSQFLYSFICLLMGVYLGCFHILGIVYNAVVNMECIFELLFLFSLNKDPEVDLVHHMLILLLIFGGSSILFSIVFSAVYIPNQKHTRVPFSPRPQHLFSF